jgi:hypothetical protein
MIANSSSLQLVKLDQLDGLKNFRPEYKLTNDRRREVQQLGGVDVCRGVPKREPYSIFAKVQSGVITRLHETIKMINMAHNLKLRETENEALSYQWDVLNFCSKFPVSFQYKQVCSSSESVELLMFFWKR